MDNLYFKKRLHSLISFYSQYDMFINIKFELDLSIEIENKKI